MSERRLTRILYELGCHPIDTTEAFAAADPEIAKELHEAFERSRDWNPTPEEKEKYSKLNEGWEARSRATIRRANLDEQSYWEDTERRLSERFGIEEAIRLLQSAPKSKHFKGL